MIAGSVAKNPPATQETQVQSLGQEDALEEGVATHFRILAWEIPWTAEPGGVAESMGGVHAEQSMRLQGWMRLSE